MSYYILYSIATRGSDVYSAKVGLGAVVLTRGQATGVPSGTMLDFRLSSDVKITR